MNSCHSFEIFKQITQIPRPSGKEEKIVQFLVDFAKSHNLKYKICGTNNVIIYKDATNGKDSTLILQCHTDMVCEKDLGLEFDFDSSPISTYIQNDFISANGTTLGADNGVGAAIILHILSSNTLKHCNIEAVFTSQEETTMEGARTLDYTLLKGKSILSLDGTNELCIDSASAGMVVLSFEKELSKNKSTDKAFKITLSGLKGGHSGEDINKNRTNAIKAISTLPYTLKNATICSLSGGNKDNAIPRDCTIEICHPDQEPINELCCNLERQIKSNNSEDENVKISVTPCSITNSLTKQESDNLTNFINEIKNGVLKVNKDNFTLTSCNLARIEIDKKAFITLSLRSSVVSYEEEYINYFITLAKKYGFECKILSKAPFFEENLSSHLIPLCKSTYKDLFGGEVASKPIHAGLEGGVFANHISNPDICVIGANLYDIHSTYEKASISSICRVEKWVEKIVEEF